MFYIFVVIHRCFFVLERGVLLKGGLENRMESEMENGTEKKKVVTN